MSGENAWDEFRCERADIFSKLENRDWFHDFLTFQAIGAFEACGYIPALNNWAIWDVHERWRDDVERISDSDFDGGDLDHFKQSGHLCFWVRRTRIILECFPNSDKAEELTDEMKDILLLYPNEYFGWDIGFKIARYFEAKRQERRLPLQFFVPNLNYIRNLCHFLSTKATSPHGVAMIYRSLFEGFRGSARPGQSESSLS